MHLPAPVCSAHMVDRKRPHPPFRLPLLLPSRWPTHLSRKLVNRAVLLPVQLLLLLAEIPRLRMLVARRV